MLISQHVLHSRVGEDKAYIDPICDRSLTLTLCLNKQGGAPPNFVQGTLPS